MLAMKLNVKGGVIAGPFGTHAKYPFMPLPRNEVTCNGRSNRNVLERVEYALGMDAN
jgi:hypothetical protein